MKLVFPFSFSVIFFSSFLTVNVAANGNVIRNLIIASNNKRKPKEETKSRYRTHFYLICSVPPIIHRACSDDLFSLTADRNG